MVASVCLCSHTGACTHMHTQSKKKVSVPKRYLLGVLTAWDYASFSNIKMITRTLSLIPFFNIVISDYKIFHAFSDSPTYSNPPPVSPLSIYGEHAWCWVFSVKSKSPGEDLPKTHRGTGVVQDGQIVDMLFSRYSQIIQIFWSFQRLLPTASVWASFYDENETRPLL